MPTNVPKADAQSVEIDSVFTTSVGIVISLESCINNSTTKKENNMKGVRISQLPHKGDNRAKDRVGEIARLIKDLDDRYYVEFSDGVKMFVWKANATHCEYLIKLTVKPLKELLNTLVDNGYKLTERGSWGRADKCTFVLEMFEDCGKQPDMSWEWEPEWLKRSFIEIERDYRGLLKEYLCYKAELAGDDFLYKADLNDLDNWTLKECKRIYEGIERAAINLNENNVNYCPHCWFYAIDCEQCSYSKRHGKCGASNSTYRELGLHKRDLRKSLKKFFK